MMGCHGFKMSFGLFWQKFSELGQRSAGWSRRGWTMDTRHVDHRPERVVIERAGKDTWVSEMLGDAGYRQPRMAFRWQTQALQRPKASRMTMRAGGLTTCSISAIFLHRRSRQPLLPPALARVEHFTG